METVNQFQWEAGGGGWRGERLIKKIQNILKVDHPAPFENWEQNP